LNTDTFYCKLWEKKYGTCTAVRLIESVGLIWGPLNKDFTLYQENRITISWLYQITNHQFKIFRLEPSRSTIRDSFLIYKAEKLRLASLREVLSLSSFGTFAHYGKRRMLKHTTLFIMTIMFGFCQSKGV